MSDLVLSVTTLKRLEDVARAENKTPAEIVEQVLNEYFEAHETVAVTEMTPEEAPLGTLAALAQAAIRADIRSGHPVDTSERVNEIMRSEFADFVRRKMDRDEAGDSDDSATG